MQAHDHPPVTTSAQIDLVYHPNPIRWGEISWLSTCLMHKVQVSTRIVGTGLLISTAILGCSNGRLESVNGYRKTSPQARICAAESGCGSG